MRYRIVAVGRVKDAAVRSACDEYLRRLRHYARVEETEVKDEARILGSIPEGSRLVALSRAGEAWTSRTLAERRLSRLARPHVAYSQRDCDADERHHERDCGFL